MESHFFDRHPRIKDALNLAVFLALIAIGTVVINTFVFRSFSVQGPSMETTFFTGDRLIVNRLPVTWAQLQNKEYVPDRGDIVVFKNPQHIPGKPDEYIVKRVIAFPGERVVVGDGRITVYNEQNPNGFNPDDSLQGPGYPTSGASETIVPDGTLYVVGDHRQGDFSCDSRACMGTIPFFDVIGPVSIRIFPFTKFRFY